MKIAFVFPGQASQYVGMGKELCEKYPEAAAVYEQADATLGFSLSRLCFEGPREELDQTAITQPAVLTTSIACLAALQKAGGPVPAAVAGHSLGEYSALVAAGSLSFSDAVRLVRKRGQFMQEAVPLGAGGMAAVMGLAGKEVAAVCQRAGGPGVVEAANLNCPGQVVIAGTNEGLNAAEPLLKEAGARRVIPLAVSAPFHSSLMLPAGERLAAELEQVTLSEPLLPVVANVSADYVRTAPEIKASLIKQVSSPVRWEECIMRLVDDGIKTFIEVGPGKVLSGLNKKICRDVLQFNVEDLASLEKVLALTKEVSYNGS
ncbi:MAG: ACP S-malonyltransferase [Peptococcaceae bacterium]|jgi:[acyl-carrier-protein] S-malonyltransferase|nr:ACP S-malonyltransferase [Peptococcaceae bacterium]